MPKITLQTLDGGPEEKCLCGFGVVLLGDLQRRGGGQTLVARSHPSGLAVDLISAHPSEEVGCGSARHLGVGFIADLAGIVWW